MKNACRPSERDTAGGSALDRPTISQKPALQEEPQPLPSVRNETR